jgi:DNA-binding NarL/FixJ family response regulator
MSEANEVAMKRGRVLVAGGHLGLLGGVYSLLEELFETVVMVADEQSLLEALPRWAPELLVVDVSLPGDKRGNIARRLRERAPECPLIVLSAHDEFAVAREVMQAGAGAFVVKRAVCTDLIPAVEAVLAGRAYVSPSVAGGRSPAPDSAREPPP